MVSASACDVEPIYLNAGSHLSEMFTRIRVECHKRDYFFLKNGDDMNGNL
jgi:hypothetical protein